MGLMMRHSESRKSSSGHSSKMEPRNKVTSTSSSAAVSRSSTIKQGQKTTSVALEGRSHGHKGSSKTQRVVTHGGAKPASQRLNTMFTDPVHMEQWVNSTTSSVLPSGSSPTDPGYNVSSPSRGAGAQKTYPVSSGTAMASTPAMYRHGVPATSQRKGQDNYIATSASASQYPAAYDAPHFPEFPGLDGFVGEQNHSDTWPYPLPQAEDATNSFPDFAFPPTGEFDPSLGLPYDWSGASHQGMTAATGADLSSSSYQSTWTPTSAFDSSVSSSCSQASMVIPLPDTPISPYLMDPTGTADMPFSLDAESGQFQALNLGESSSPVAYFKEGFDADSTLKPCRQFQRTPLPNMNGWPVSQTPGRPVVHSNGFVEHGRQLSTGEPSNAREHHYYSLGPRKDGLYHCPFGMNGDCQHKPEKLKCNYDKHLDSHLKPYRCKIAACAESQFSSTACLLRHEREAHGMHGHGDKPHVCYFSECDRSFPGNGFPRRWNLFDHMKRVHDYTGSTSSSGSGGSPPASSSVERHGSTTLPIRNGKRRQPSPIQAEPMKRSRSNQMAPSGSKSSTVKSTKASHGAAAAAGHPSSNSNHKHRQSLQKSFEQQKAALQAQVDNLQPYDPQGFREMTAHYHVLNTVAMDLQRQDARDVAHGMGAF